MVVSGGFSNAVADSVLVKASQLIIDEYHVKWLWRVGIGEQLHGVFGIRRLFDVEAPKPQVIPEYFPSHQIIVNDEGVDYVV